MNLRNLNDVLTPGEGAVHTATELPWLDIDAADSLIPKQTLAVITASFAVRADLWQHLVRHDPRRRWFQRLLLTDALEVWLIGWAPGQSTPVHDHGGAVGALTVTAGALTEEDFPSGLGEERRRRLHEAPTTLTFEPHHIHRVVNLGLSNATSIHAYSPPALPMRTIDGNPDLASKKGSADWEAAL